jgi:putative cell wall-binding protein
VSITGSTFTGNTADGDSIYTDGDAGAVELYALGSASITDSIFSDNEAFGDGGGARLYDIDATSITSSTFSGNTAGDGGGAMKLYDTDGASIEDSTFSGNDAYWHGGGIFVYESYGVSIVNSTISGNEAGAVGGGLFVYGSSVDVQSSTIAGNTAGLGGGNVFLHYYSEATFENTIIGDGVASGVAPTGAAAPSALSVNAPDLGGDGTSSATVTFSLVESTDYDLLTVADGGGNLNVDPMLAALANNGGTTLTHLPSSESPVIDAGDPSYSASTTDQRGATRVQGAAVDMGSVETSGGGGGGGGDSTPPTRTIDVPPPDEPGGTSIVEIETPFGTITVIVEDPDEGTQIVIREVSSGAVDDDEGTDLLPIAYEIEVVNGEGKKTTVCLPYTDSELETAGIDEDALQLFHFPDGGGIEVITATRDADGNTVCGETDSFSPFALGQLDTTRIAGATAIDTAVAISEATFADGADTVFLATRSGYADVLGAGPAAAAAGAPILLTEAGELPASTLAELQRLSPSRIVVVGGTGAISDDVVASLQGLAATVERVAGADRFATAAAISADTFEPGVPVAYVATGNGFADGLVAGAAAAGDGGGPVLLTDGSTLSEATIAELERLQPGRIVVVGGTAAVGDDVVAALGAFTDGDVTRLAGTDRYATAAAVASTFDPGTAVFVATGTAPWDALAGAPAAAAAHAALLLTQPDGLPASTADALDALAPPSVTVLGGTAAVSLDTELDLARHVES